MIMDKHRVVFASSFHVLFLCLVASVALGASVERVAAAGEAGTAVEEKKKAKEIAKYYDDFYKKVGDVLESLVIAERADFTRCKATSPAPAAKLKAAEEPEADLPEAVGPEEEKAVKPFIDKLRAAIKLLKEKLQSLGPEAIKKNIDAMNTAAKDEKDCPALRRTAKSMTVNPEAVKEVIGKVEDLPQSAKDVLQTPCSRTYKSVDSWLKGALSNLREIQQMAEGAKTWQAKVFAEPDPPPSTGGETTKDDGPRQEGDGPRQRQLSALGEKETKSEKQPSEDGAAAAFQGLACFFLFVLVTFLPVIA